MRERIASGSTDTQEGANVTTSRPTPNRAARIIGSIVVFLGGVLVGIAAVVFLVYYTAPELTKYAGDGEIDSIGTPIITPGYTIEFTAFDMSQSFAKDFRIAGLPQKSRGPAYFQLRVISLTPYEFYGGRTPADRPTGTLRLLLQRETGEPVFDVSGPVTGYRGEDSNTNRGGFYEYNLYFDDTRTEVDPRSLEPDSALSFRVEYEPGEAPIRGFAVPMIRVGGYL